MSEAQGALSRINGLRDVIGTMIVAANGNVLRTTLPQDLAFKYATKIPSLAAMARSGVRELDPQNDLQMLRIKTLLHEIIVIAEPLFTLLVVQNCKEKDPTPESSSSPDEDKESSSE
ncbi:dynein light chain roadblock-type 2 [Selaginella moellendorffii]|uniref:dynein light chain roadblock-type 2 n=1 Tax=Selaginella moellendorffii TaxID=88036 RepID=UPI000D1CD859|nr:dynein light chain roadblock-type 2 [Selaginella moellendorffii]|eukprot:XP_002984172.2 dynein light chain roadblock-type 2 [Selaginella moellendorffii]